ncbi:rolling circle replication-associated protein [Clostridium butyricum]|uniref:rolling circle replication-associated protein n=1 Tax=Clostridium butyricum TaxID=1492 RepID=UPI003D3378E5
MKKNRDYDYENVYSKLLREETKEEIIEDLRLNNNYVYYRRRITSGNMVELEIYPIWKCKHDIPRRKDRAESKESQKNLNNKNSKKKVVRLVNANFGKDDLYITLTYTDGYIPNEEQARKDMQNYIKRLKYYRKKNGLEDLKYIYSIGYENEPKKSKKVRIHHHLIINKMDRDIVEDIWGKGRADCKRLKPDDFELTGVAKYIASQGPERWSASRNLKKPNISTSRTGFTRRRALKLISEPGLFKEIFEKQYPDLIYKDYEAYYSEESPGVYIYVRMRKREYA